MSGEKKKRVNDTPN